MKAGSYLIVNADDFGISETVNNGIVAAYDGGVVTSTSIMATGAAFEHAVAVARLRPRLAVGVHLVLTERQPLSRPESVPSLLDSGKRFPPHIRKLLHRALGRGLDMREVYRELEAQLLRVIRAGLSVSHLDGHQHVHVLPGVARVVMELATTYGIGAIRHPSERVRAYMLRDGTGSRRLAEQLALRTLCTFSPAQSLRRADDFAGFFYGGRLYETNLTTVIAGLSAGHTVELMCHPGSEDMHPESDWRYAWAAERDALMSPRVRDLIAARGFRLTSGRGVRA